jgi:hypothetical protein
MSAPTLVQREGHVPPTTGDSWSGDGSREGGVHDDPAAYHDSFKESRGMTRRWSVRDPWLERSPAKERNCTLARSN